MRFVHGRGASYLLFCLGTALAQPHVALGGSPRASLEDDLFGEDPASIGSGEDAKALLERERLQIGGMLYLRFMAFQFQDGQAPDVGNSNLVDLYLDARPSDRVRGYVQGRLRYQPATAFPIPVELRPGAPVDLMPAPLETSVQLDQLWLTFDIQHRLFVTVGKQAVRWGATRLWNPVDVIHPNRRDPLALFDERTGIPMARFEWPIPRARLALSGLVLMDGVERGDDLGGALRIESAFPRTNLGLSAMARPGRDPLWGLDLSTGLWEFDVTAEAALRFPQSEDPHNEWFHAGSRQAVGQVAAGIEYLVKYSDADFLGVGAEYFYNPDGRTHYRDYLPALLFGSGSPFYLGRHYAALLFLLPNPGNWNSTSFVLSNVGNLSDQSFLSRLDVRTTMLTWMTLELYTAVHYGTKGGEFRFAVNPDDLPPLSLSAFGIEGDYRTWVRSGAAPVVDLGINLRIDL